MDSSVFDAMCLKLQLFGDQSMEAALKKWLGELPDKDRRQKIHTMLEMAQAETKYRCVFSTINCGIRARPQDHFSYFNSLFTKADLDTLLGLKHSLSVEPRLVLEGISEENSRWVPLDFRFLRPWMELCDCIIVMVDMGETPYDKLKYFG